VNASTIRLAPPLTVTEPEIDEAIAILSTAIASQLSGGVTDE
jgi:4-aminobutyrate aminotransferase-like enzyme